MSNPSRLRAEHEALFHSSLIGAAYISAGHFVRVNEEFARILGRRAAELAGAPAGDFAADPRPDPPAHSSYQREHVRPDGDRRLLLIEETPIEGEHRAPGRLVTVVDITDRQRHAAALENARALLMRAVNSMSDGFVLFDADDRILLCNQVYTSMLEGAGAEGAFGTAESMIGMHVEEIIRKQIAQGQPVPAEYAGDIGRWVRDRVAQHRAAVAAKIIDALSQPIPLPSGTPVVVVQVGCSIGVAIYPGDGADADTLIRLADAAMYQAKESGRGRFLYHNGQV